MATASHQNSVAIYIVMRIKQFSALSRRLMEMNIINGSGIRPAKNGLRQECTCWRLNLKFIC